MSSKSVLVDPFFNDDVIDGFWEKYAQELKDACYQKIIEAQERARKERERADMLERKLSVAIHVIHQVRRSVKLEN